MMIRKNIPIIVSLFTFIRKKIVYGVFQLFFMHNDYFVFKQVIKHFIIH